MEGSWWWMILLLSLFIIFIFHMYCRVDNKYRKLKHLTELKVCENCKVNRDKLNKILNAYKWDMDPKNARVEDENGNIHHPIRPQLPHEISPSFILALRNVGGDDMANELEKNARDFLKPV